MLTTEDVFLQLLDFFGFCHVTVQGFIGLEKLGQQDAAAYVLAAFSSAAAAASEEELCHLGREILLTGTLQKTLCGAFAKAVAAVLERRQRDVSDDQQGSRHRRTTAELAQWLDVYRRAQANEIFFNTSRLVTSKHLDLGRKNSGAEINVLRSSP